MQAPNDHRELREKVMMYLDKAMNPEAQREFIQHSENDPECAKILNREKGFRHFVKNNVMRPKVDDDFISSLKERCRIL